MLIRPTAFLAPFWQPRSSDSVGPTKRGRWHKRCWSENLPSRFAEQHVTLSSIRMCSGLSLKRGERLDCLNEPVFRRMTAVGPEPELSRSPVFPLPLGDYRLPLREY